MYSIKSSNIKYITLKYISCHCPLTSVHCNVNGLASQSSLHLPFLLFPHRRPSLPLSLATPVKVQLHLNALYCAKDKRLVLTKLKTQKLNKTEAGRVKSKINERQRKGGEMCNKKKFSLKENLRVYSILPTCHW